ncbi:MAG: Phospholipid methyltransferase [Candidatus Parcubacteria bacterium]
MGDDSGETLFTGGPYRFTRHPYYAGAILVGIGLYLQLNYWLALLMIPVAIFIAHVIKKEDVFLEQRFGQTFVDYKKKTGVVPWFY